MKKILVLVAVIAASFLAGCGDDSISDDDDSNGGTSSYQGATLNAYRDDVKTCTPYIGSAVFSSGSSVLSSWTGSSRTNSNGVLGKMFNTTLDDYQSIYTQLSIFDEHIELVNGFSESFDIEGEATAGDDTATVETEVNGVDVPFLKWFFQEVMSVPVDRIVTVRSGSLTVHMAFMIVGDREVIVEQYTSGTTDAGVFYAIRNGSSLGVWHASVTDSDKGIQFMWDGDMEDRTFRLSVCTDAGGNWEAMGGGGVESSSEMAFMARNNATTGSDREYYITLDINDFNNSTDVTITDAGLNPPNGTGALRYITDDSEDCLGFYPPGDFPQSVDDLRWDN